MKTSLIEAATKGSAVWRAAMKTSGLSQRKIAHTLSISQARISRIANAQAIPLAHEWIEFATLTGIPLQSYVDGYIDGAKPIELAERVSRLGDFRIPERYAVEQGSSSRTVRVYTRFLKTCIGEKKGNDLIQHLGMDPDYFVDYNHKINVRFNLDLMNFMVREKFLTTRTLHDFCNPLRSPTFHGPMGEVFLNCSDLTAFLTTFCEMMNRFEVNHICRVEQGTQSFADLSLTPTERMHRFQHPELKKFWVVYFGQVILSFLAMLQLPEKREVKIIEDRYQPGQKVIYRIILASDFRPRNLL